MSQTTQSLPVNTDEIKGYRTQIDAIDEKIQTLINERAKVAQQVAVAKKNPKITPSFIALSEKLKY
ncbi:Chorismate mutase I [Moraxella catarrhalis]|nr:Chorismate mutase I [Moraxella catarrhalis]OAV31301.1 Chorismate mutase I [Moraxella catarrhalis]OAV37965.1 Chorismate mutase I [Moraxella catarrhalis]